MLEPNAQAIFSPKNASVGFDSDVGDTVSTKSTGNSEFVSELNRAQESIASDKSSRTSRDSSSYSSSQSDENALNDSRITSKRKNTESNTPRDESQNADAVAGATDENRASENRLLHGGNQSFTDNDANLNPTRDTILRGDLNTRASLEPDGDPHQLANSTATEHIHGKQIANSGVANQVTNGDISSTDALSSATSPDSLTQKEALLKAAAGEQYDQELTGSKYASNTPAADERLHDGLLDNQRTSLAAPIQSERNNALSEGVVALNGSDNLSIAATKQEIQTASGKLRLAAGIEEGVSASSSAAASGSADPDGLVTAANKAKAFSNAKADGLDAQSNTAVVTQDGVAAFGNTIPSGAAGSLGKNDGSSGGIATSATERQTTTAANGAQGAALNSGLTSSAGVNSSAHSSAHSVVAGHEFLRSIAASRTDTQPGNTSQTTLSAGANSADSENILDKGVTQTGRMTTPTGTAPLGTAVDPAVLVNKAQASAGNVDGVDTLALNAGIIGGSANASGYVGTNADSGSSQHTLSHTAARFDVNADKGITNVSIPNAELNQIKATDVTPRNQIKQLLGAQQQSEMTGLQALNNSIDTPSSNVYHVTTNGIITANSTALNAAPLSDLATAPRTVLLDQPNADQSLVENLRWAVNEKLSRVTVNVSPANLGPISVSVDVENQNMSVSIVTNNVIAKEAIDSILPRMREHFSNEGYSQVSVDVSSQQERNSNLRNQTAEFFDNQNNAESNSQNAEPQLKISSQENSTPEQSLLLSKLQPSSHSLIDTYA